MLINVLAFRRKISIALVNSQNHFVKNMQEDKIIAQNAPASLV